MLLLRATHVRATTWRSFVGARRESWVDAALTRASRRLQKRPQPPRRLPSPWMDRERDLGRKRERIEKGGEVNKGVTVLPRRGNRSCLRASSVRTCRGGTEASDSSYRASWPPSQ